MESICKGCINQITFRHKGSLATTTCKWDIPQNCMEKCSGFQVKPKEDKETIKQNKKAPEKEGQTISHIVDIPHI